MDSKLPLKDKVNDMTQIAKQLIDLAFVSNQNKQKAQSQPGQSQNLDPNTVNLYSKESNLYHQEKLVNLLQNIETSYNKKVDLAVNQRVLHNSVQNLRKEITDKNNQLKTFLNRLKKSENLLADALHEAKDKLLKIKLAESSNISTDELIRYSYIISRAESISAPIDWMAGDQRRPFPTEIQMTQGLLHASNNETMLANLNQGQGNNANNKNNKNNQNSKNLLDGKLNENKDDLPPVSEDIDQFELEEVKHDEKNSSENDDEDVDFGW